MKGSKFPKFRETYVPDPDALGPATSWSDHDTKRLLGFDCEPYTRFMSTTARSSFNGGLLRFCLPNTEPSIWAWNSPEGWSDGWGHALRKG